MCVCTRQSFGRSKARAAAAVAKPRAAVLAMHAHFAWARCNTNTHARSPRQQPQRCAHRQAAGAAEAARPRPSRLESCAAVGRRSRRRGGRRSRGRPSFGVLGAPKARQPPSAARSRRGERAALLCLWRIKNRVGWFGVPVGAGIGCSQAGSVGLHSIRYQRRYEANARGRRECALSYSPLKMVSELFWLPKRCARVKSLQDRAQSVIRPPFSPME